MTLRMEDLTLTVSASKLTIFVVYPCLIGIPAATIATTYRMHSLSELEELSRQTETLRAYSGGDGPERQLRTLLTILMLRDSDELKVMIPGSEIVLLTDAISHELDLEDDVIDKARELKVCISFYLSFVTWEPYTRIAAQTGGAIVNSIHRESFRHFDDDHDYGQCARFYGLETPIIDERKKRSAATSFFTTEQRCHYFSTSSFTSSLTVQGYTSQPIMIVTRPDSEEVHVTNNFEGNKIYRDTDPIPGQYSVCVENETLTIYISLNTIDRMNSIFQFLVSQVDLTYLNNSPPPACKFQSICPPKVYCLACEPTSL